MADESNIQSFEEAQQSYGDIFDPEKYMQSYYGEMLKTENCLFKPWIDVLDEPHYDAVHASRFKMRNMKFCIENVLTAMKGPLKVLDIGTGPFCGNLMYMSSFDNVTSIVCSDFLESCRNYIHKTLSSKPSDKTNGQFDWSKFNERFYGDSNSTLIDSFRNKCKAVKHVDISNLESGLKEVSDLGPYDVITSEWTFSDGTRDRVEYEALLGKCNTMLNIGGSLILSDVLEENFAVTSFEEDGKRMRCVNVSEEWIRGAIERQGFAIEQTILFFNREQDSGYFDGLGELIVWATKLK